MGLSGADTVSKISISRHRRAYPRVTARAGAARSSRSPRRPARWNCRWHRRHAQDAESSEREAAGVTPREVDAAASVWGE